MSFYPPGWDYDRHTTLFGGLREAGLFDHVMEVAERRDQEARAAADAQKPEDEKLAQREIFSPYLDNLKNVFKFSDQWSDWAQWAKFRSRWDQIMQQEIAEYHNYHPKLDRAIEVRKNRWVEDPTLDSASSQEVSRRFDEMWPNLSRGYSTSVCLMVTPDSLESVLNSPLPSSAPQAERKELPFVLAISRVAHEIPIEQDTEELEKDTDCKPRTYFRVAVESLMNDLYWITALDIMDLASYHRSSST
ncbi:uncharacterized protein N7477_005234 [Penicillium maclennaniae]|uniref:uncharacterized protein n=1 Tax=Penicillium maclennaniae TaxID=1343394 RepID=UPI0025415CC7|nr:uncharacterized protein N7477_005234 [Penicillium maclennaniae]KAJ5675300.1 hypothetical protein N7477_005234 [Penicillium maclennaniae]